MGRQIGGSLQADRGVGLPHSQSSDRGERSVGRPRSCLAFTLVRQEDLEPVFSTGAIHIAQSVSIIGPGRDQLTIDGLFAWIDRSGHHNAGFPDSSTSLVTNLSGILFTVGTEGQDNSAIRFELADMTVTGTNGLLIAEQGAQSSSARFGRTGTARRSKPGRRWSVRSRASPTSEHGLRRRTRRE
ncbi:MAG: hypothetical protein ACI8QZ_003049 [Chlamydiales bacterium]|jgi:hypothetical protein